MVSNHFIFTTVEKLMKPSHFGTSGNVNVELCVTSSRVAQFVISLIFLQY